MVWRGTLTVETKMDNKTKQGDKQSSSSHTSSMYLRFGAMILTAMVVMYAVMRGGPG